MSKYLHFHAPVVPIYDSIVVNKLRAWYPLRGRALKAFPMPPAADDEYWRLCVRIGYVVDEWESVGLTPTAVMIDNYVYRYTD